MTQRENSTANASHCRVYHDDARLWPIINPPDDCEGEAELLLDLLRSHVDSDARPRVLELGSGAGSITTHLLREADVTAVDLSEPLVALSRERNRRANHVVADMRTFRLGMPESTKFDAVFATDCLDYMTTRDDLEAALETAAAHLPPGGLLVAAVNYVRETFVTDDRAEDCRTVGDLTIRYITHVCDPDPADTTFDFTMLLTVHEAGTLRVIEDRHTCGLFPLDAWDAALAAAGFDGRVMELHPDGELTMHARPAATTLSDGSPWFVCTKR